MTQHLSLSEAATLLRCSPKTLAYWLKQNPQQPPLYAKPGRDYLFSPADVDRIYDTMKNVAVSDRKRVSIPAPRSEAAIYAQLQKLTGKIGHR